MPTSVADSPEASATASPGGPSPAADLGASGRIGFHIPTRLELIETAAGYVCRQAKSLNLCDDDRAGKLGVALHEALTNAMVHGNLGIPSSLKEQPDNAFGRALAAKSADRRLADRKVSIELEFTRTGCEISITDDGAGFDVALVAPTDGPEDPDEEEAANQFLSGRGILMMRAFTDGVRFAQGGRQAIMTLVRHGETDRRAGPRVPAGGTVQVYPLDGDEAGDFDPTAALEGTGLEACVANVSQEGAALVLASRLRSARRILIDAADGGQPLAADVCRVVPIGDGIIQIGCRFVAPPASMRFAANEGLEPCALPDAVNSILETLARREPLADERRGDHRYLYSVRVGVRPVGSNQTTETFSRDLSRRGLALIASAAYPIGRHLVITLTGPSGEPLPQVIATVVRCQRVTNGVFDIGCEFTDSSNS